MRIVYILGTPFCGSTVLANVLETGGAKHVGEIDRLPKYQANRYPTTTCECCAAKEQSCPVFGEEFLAELQSIPLGAEVYLRLATRLGSDVVIDGSKHASWFRRSYLSLDQKTAKDACAIICVRNPFGFVESYARANRNLPLWRVAEVWRDTYIDILKTTGRLEIPKMVITNEAFAGAHERTIDAIGRFVGVPIAANVRGYPLGESHSLGGNAAYWAKAVADRMIRVRQPRPINEGLSSELMATVVNTPGLYSLATDVFGYDISRALIGEGSD